MCVCIYQIGQLYTFSGSTLWQFQWDCMVDSSQFIQFYLLILAFRTALDSITTINNGFKTAYTVLIFWEIKLWMAFWTLNFYRSCFNITCTVLPLLWLCEFFCYPLIQIHAAFCYVSYIMRCRVLYCNVLPHNLHGFCIVCYDALFHDPICLRAAFVSASKF